MASENDVAKKEKSIQNKIDYLKILTEDYKKGVEECIAPKISSNAMFIERWRNLLEQDKEYFMTHQQRVFEDLEGQYITYFQKLVNGHCECKPITKK
jgi:hypothetical protein